VSQVEEVVGGEESSDFHQDHKYTDIMAEHDRRLEEEIKRIEDGYKRVPSQ
jgi:hypothetical protein